MRCLNQLLRISICASLVAILGCGPSESTLEKWFKSGQEERILSLYSEGLLDKDLERQNKSLSIIAEFIARHPSSKTHQKFENMICDDQINSNLKTIMLKPICGTNLIPIDGLRIFKYYIEHPDIDHILQIQIASYISKIDEQNLFQDFKTRYDSMLRSNDPDRASSMLSLYGNIGPQFQKRISPQLSCIQNYNNTTKDISELNAYIATLTSQIEDQKNIIQTNEDRFNSEKANQTKSFILNAFMIGKHSNAEYEIDVYGKRALLIALKTEFTTKGYFNLPVKKLMDMPVKIKEEYGGFDQNWPVFIEIDPKEEQANLQNIATILDESKKKLYELEDQLQENNSALKNKIEHSKAILVTAYFDQGQNASSASSNGEIITDKVPKMVTQSSANDSQTADQIEVQLLFNKWIEEIRNPKSDLSIYYSDYLNYYKIANCPKSRLIQEKKQFWAKYDKLSLEISNVVSHKIGTDSWQYDYDKLFTASNVGNDKKYSGKVKSIVIFQKVDKKWVITTEKDEKTYYTNHT